MGICSMTVRVKMQLNISDTEQPERPPRTMPQDLASVIQLSDRNAIENEVDIALKGKAQAIGHLQPKPRATTNGFFQSGPNSSSPSSNYLPNETQMERQDRLQSDDSTCGRFKGWDSCHMGYHCCCCMKPAEKVWPRTSGFWWGEDLNITSGAKMSLVEALQACDGHKACKGFSVEGVLNQDPPALASYYFRSDFAGDGWVDEKKTFGYWLDKTKVPNKPNFVSFWVQYERPARPFHCQCAAPFMCESIFNSGCEWWISPAT